MEGVRHSVPVVDEALPKREDATTHSKEAPLDILLLEKDPLVRDQCLIGYQSFPDISVELSQGFQGLNLARQRNFDFIVIGCNPKDQEGLELLEALREFDKQTPVILVTTPKLAKKMQPQRSRLGLLSILQVPIDPKEFFRVLSRMRRKLASA
ncbi:MAG TPA: response regulator [Planctomycetes bacterium]|nr:response regulator [Planctomycetota bacterium]